MEKNKNNHASDHILGMGKAPFMVKIFIAVAVLFVFYLVGIAVGSNLGIQHSLKTRIKFDQSALDQQGFAAIRVNNSSQPPVSIESGECPMAGKGHACMMADRIGGDPAQKSSIFGVILRVERNKITILDNSNDEQAVISTQKTRILKDGIDISISALKENQNIIIEIQPNKDNAMEAVLIKVL